MSNFEAQMFDRFISDVTGLILQGETVMKRAAKTLGISHQTMVRRLKDRGTCWKDLKMRFSPSRVTKSHLEVKKGKEFLQQMNIIPASDLNTPQPKDLNTLSLLDHFTSSSENRSEGLIKGGDLHQADDPGLLEAEKKIKNKKIVDSIKSTLEQSPSNMREVLLPILITYYTTADAEMQLKIFDKIKGYLKDVDQLKVDDGTKVDDRRYKRPVWAVERQIEIANAVIFGKSNVSVSGDRQTGKDCSVGVGVFEDLITRECDWFYMSTKRDTAITVMDTIINRKTWIDLSEPSKKHQEKKMFSYIHDWIKDEFYGKGEIIFYNQVGTTSKLSIIDTTESAVKGVTGNLWIDDIDTIIKDKKEDVITKAIAITRSNPNLRVVFTSNMGKGAYVKLMKAWEEFTADMQLFSLEKKDVKHIVGEKDAFLHATMTALSGQSEADAQLLNIRNKDDDCFNLESIERAYKIYDGVNKLGLHARKTILIVDPSGEGHAMGWGIYSYDKDKDFVWERESGEIPFGAIDDITGQIWDHNHVISFLSQKCRQYYCSAMKSEPNYNGTSIIISFREKGFTTGTCVFGGAVTNVSHHNKIAIVRYLLDNDRLALKNKDTLQHELFAYNPNISRGEDRKGNIADTLMHGVWELVGGLDYLKEQERKIQQSVHYYEDTSGRNVSGSYDDDCYF